MLKITQITDITYLTGSVAAPTFSLGPVDARLESPGEWWCPDDWIVADRQAATTISIMRLSQGRHPKTERRMIVGLRNKRRAGYDLTFSAPKEWTALWTISDAPGRKIMDAMLFDAVRESLDSIVADGLVEARMGKSGTKREPVSRLVAVLFRHRSSRKGDPQAHIHAVLLNIGMRQDGQVRAINNEKLYASQKSIGAAFRFRLSEKLESIGVPVHGDPMHALRIEGQPVKLAEIWSKRRKQIVAAAYTSGLQGTAGHPKVVDRLVKRTRGKKIELPAISVLEARWQIEAWDAGWRPFQTWCTLDRPMICRSSLKNDAAADKIVAEALTHITQQRSIFRRTEIEAMALTLAVGRSSIRAVRKAVDATMVGAKIIDLKRGGYLTTQTVLDQEIDIVRICQLQQSQSVRRFSDLDLMWAPASKRCSQAQMAAIQHSLSNDGASAVEVIPGMDHRTIPDALLRASQHGNRRLIIVIPPGATADICEIETTPNAHIFDFDQFVEMLDVNMFCLRLTDVIVIDRASMLGVPRALAILRWLHQANAKIIFQDNVHRFMPDNRSDLFELIIRAIGSQQIREIERQQSQWQREASVQAYCGELKRALQTYADNGAVTAAYDPDTALGMIVEAFTEIKGDAVVVTAIRDQAIVINNVLRGAARVAGIIGKKDVVIRAISLSSKGRPTPVDLPIAQNDRLIVTGQCTIGNVTLNDRTLLVANSIFLSRQPQVPDRIELLTTDGSLIVTTSDELAHAGINGRPIAMQHAYCLTTKMAEGLTWRRTFWLTSREGARSALVALTRHYIDLRIFIDRSALARLMRRRRPAEHRATFASEPEFQQPDNRDIIKIFGMSIERITKPRNALDVFGSNFPRKRDLMVTKSSAMINHTEELSRDREGIIDWKNQFGMGHSSQSIGSNEPVEPVGPPDLDELSPGM